MARIVVPDVTQSGNHRAAIFLADDDYALTRDLLATETRGITVTMHSFHDRL